MNMEQPAGDSTENNPAPKWQTLDSSQRRILGVLIEKAKTTPDGYPLSINALANGCNQKSNRDPQMNLDVDDVEVSLSELRQMGAIAEIQGGGRVAKYRHYAKDWFGVDKFELAVIAELMLRGEQTLGDLRGRAARMEAIADIGALRPIVASLIEKGLMIELTLAGRGQMVTHNLYKPEELGRLREKFGPAPAPGSTAQEPTAKNCPSQSSSLQNETASSSTSSTFPCPINPIASPATHALDSNRMEDLEAEVGELRSEVLELKQQVESLQDKIDQIMS